MMNTEVPESFLVSILRTLEELQIPYFVVGGFAAVIYGISRVTYDVDIVVKLKVHQIPLLTNRYPLPRYYADAEQIQSSIAIGIAFNLIDSQTGEKADVIPATAHHNKSFQRRVRQTVVLPMMSSLDIWCASVEDIILGKLQAWVEVTSRKHERDILEMVIVALRQEGTPNLLDTRYIDAEARKISENAYEFWRALLQHAQDT